MFDGMPEQFLTPTTSLPPSFSLHHSNFQQHQQQQQQCFDVMMPTCLVQQVGSEPSSLILPQCVVNDNAPWSSEEVLSLLKTISSLDSPWFPSPFTWDNVSRKLAEVGFKRSAQKCKEKFEEETRSFNNNSHKSNVISQNYRLFGELEDLYNNNNTSNNNNNDNDDANNVNDGNYANDHLDDDGREQQSRLDNTFDDYPTSEQMMNKNDDNENDNSDLGDEEGGQGVVGGSEEREEEAKRVMVRKRKREKKFEMFKGFCENVVNKVIAKQEEMHCKVLEDMLKREEEKIAREEAWKKQEIDRITQVMQVRAHEQAIVGDRQAKILGFLKKFSSFSSNNNGESNQSLEETLGSVVLKVQNTSTNSLLSTSSSMLSQDTISETTTTTTHDQVSNLASQSSPNRLESNPQLAALPMLSSSPNQPFKNQVELLSFDHTSTDATGQVVSFESSGNHNDSNVVAANVKDDTGRRWPRDEVLALINIRCNLFDNNNSDHRDRESFSKGPLWERISQKMMELGYKRSAKRCKEKWENINKYFRKTKDSSKKRSIDSRTCPYFHQLSHLYNQQGASHDGQFDRPTNPGGLSGNQRLVPSNGETTTNSVPSQQNKGTVEQLSTCQVSSTLNFDYTIS